jgi:glycosyltransferase involved in cell wall biosynthesis
MIIGLYHPIVGGAEKVCQSLSKSLHQRGVPVTVLTQHRDGLPDFEIIEEIPVHRKMKWWHPFGIAYMVSVLLFLVRSRRQYDIIQCFGLFLFIPPALIMRYLFKKKLVLRLLCSGPYGDFAGVEGMKCKQLIISCAQRADRVVYMTADMKQELLDHRFSEEKLVFIPNGVDTERYLPSVAPAQHVCFVGRVEAQKGLVYLLRAFSIIIQEGCRATKLLVVGDGKQKPLLEDLSRHLSIDNQVVFTGPSEDVRNYYQQARVFVLPSLSEGMSSALLEAMSCGLAVITTRVGASEALVGADLQRNGLQRGHCHIGRRGIVVNSHDEQGLAESLRLLLQDTRLSKRLGDRAREFVITSCSYENMVNSYQVLYRRLG